MFSYVWFCIRVFDQKTLSIKFLSHVAIWCNIFWAWGWLIIWFLLMLGGFVFFCSLTVCITGATRRTPQSNRMWISANSGRCGPLCPPMTDTDTSILKQVSFTMCKKDYKLLKNFSCFNILFFHAEVFSFWFYIFEKLIIL